MRWLLLTLATAAAAAADDSPTCTYESNTDFDPDSHTNVGAASAEECCSACKKHCGCQAAVLFGPTCYLKLVAVLQPKHKAGATACRITGPPPPPCPPGPPPPPPPPPPARHIWHDFQPGGGPFLPSSWPPTYDVARSTIMMPCRTAGLMEPEAVRGWGVVSYDWSNGKAQWTQATPMNCTEMLEQQAALTKSAFPQAKVWVYRNSILALPWFSSVRTKLNDAAYEGWFMHYSKNGKANASYHNAPCGHTGSGGARRVCTELWHDSSAPRGDVGPNIPSGQYVFNMRAANRSVHGVTFLEWYIDDYVLGNNGSGHPAVSGYFFDDHWDDFLAPVSQTAILLRRRARRSPGRYCQRC
jgi:hypothetical protein